MKKRLTAKRTEISIWERRILNGNGILLIVIYCLATSIPTNISQYEKFFLLGAVVIAIMIIGTSMIMTITSVNANEYKLQAQLNEQYLQTQLDYFNTYKETQAETRRIKHDMKNHMLALSDMYERGEYEQLGNYVSDLSRLTQKLEMEYHIGNDIADAILNEKLSKKNKEKFKLIIDGSMAGIHTIAPIDICTIFANAIDNAIEAVEQMDVKQKMIHIIIKRSENILVIDFRNPVASNIDLTEKNPKTSKRDKVNHGFGLQNIEAAVEKYNGMMDIAIREKLNQRYFCLSIILST
jgi:sensor histidine kinase regulating citrate/malate metabolism